MAQKRAFEVNRLIPEEARKGRILDIGCGRYPFFLNSIKFEEKYGLEKNTGLLAGRSEWDPIILKAFDIHSAERVPFSDNYFNVVTMLAVFEHIWPEKLPRILNEIWRVLRSGGYLIFTTPAAWTNKLLRFLATLNLVSPEEISDHKVLYTPSAIDDILSQTEFKNCQKKISYFELHMNIIGFIAKV